MKRSIDKSLPIKQSKETKPGLARFVIVLHMPTNCNKSNMQDIYDLYLEQPHSLLPFKSGFPAAKNLK